MESNRFSATPCQSPTGVLVIRRIERRMTYIKLSIGGLIYQRIFTCVVGDFKTAS